MKASRREWNLLGIPIDCSGRDIGLQLMPAAFRSAGIVEKVGALDRGDLPIRIGSPDRDPATGIIDFHAVHAASILIQDAIRSLLNEPNRPLVLGGCCTLLIGVCAALKSKFRNYGLAFVDGHLDFYDGRSSPTGEAADMDLAMLSGIGPRGLIDLAGPPPLAAPDNIAALGFRDEAEAARHHAPDPRTYAPEMTLVDVNMLRWQGAARVGRETAGRFARNPGRFWLHFDLDVLDEKVMPAVDYRMPGGLDWNEAEMLLRPLATSPALIGIDVTILNPRLDPSGEHTRRAVDFLERLLKKPESHRSRASRA